MTCTTWMMPIIILSGSPDRGLTMQQMSGKKRVKFWITLELACNADGCFSSGSIKILTFSCFNLPRLATSTIVTIPKHGWQNILLRSELSFKICKYFYTWIKSLNLTMDLARMHICLLVNNFSGHYINYKLKNIDLEYLKPNLTFYVQPNDAGIILTALVTYSGCTMAVGDELHSCSM